MEGLGCTEARSILGLLIWSEAINLLVVLAMLSFCERFYGMDATTQVTPVTLQYRAVDWHVPTYAAKGAKQRFRVQGLDSGFTICTIF